MGLLMAGLDKRLSPTSVVTLTAWVIALSRLIVLSLPLPLDGCVAFQIALVWNSCWHTGLLGKCQKVSKFPPPVPPLLPPLPQHTQEPLTTLLCFLFFVFLKVMRQILWLKGTEHI